MTVHVFFNPELVGQLAACGITRRQPSPAAGRGFVLEGRRSAPIARETVTNVIAVQGGVTITRSRLLLPSSRPETTLLPAAEVAPQTALELVEECARLRRDNRRLSDEVARLRAEVDRLTAGPSAPRQHEAPDLDDSARRFSLLELDL